MTKKTNPTKATPKGPQGPRCTCVFVHGYHIPKANCPIPEHRIKALSAAQKILRAISA